MPGRSCATRSSSIWAPRNCGPIPCGRNSRRSNSSTTIAPHTSLPCTAPKTMSFGPGASPARLERLLRDLGELADIVDPLELDGRQPDKSHQDTSHGNSANSA